MDETIVTTEATTSCETATLAVETLEKKIKNMDHSGLAVLKLSDLSLGELNAMILRKEELHKIGQKRLRALAAAMQANPA